MQTFCAFCYRVFLAGAAKCGCSIWSCGMLEPLSNARTSPELSCLATQAASSRLGVLHAHHPCSLQTPGVGTGAGARGAGSAPAGPVAFVAADSHRLLSDARPWRSFPRPGERSQDSGRPGGAAGAPRRPRGHRLESTSTTGFIADQARLQNPVSSAAGTGYLYKVFGVNL